MPHGYDAADAMRYCRYAITLLFRHTDGLYAAATPPCLRHAAASEPPHYAPAPMLPPAAAYCYAAVESAFRAMMLFTCFVYLLTPCASQRLCHA